MEFALVNDQQELVSTVDAMLAGAAGMVVKAGAGIVPHLTLLAMGYKATETTLSVIARHREQITKTYDAYAGEIFTIQDHHIAVRVPHDDIDQLWQALLDDLKRSGENPVHISAAGLHVTLATFDSRENRDAAFARIKDRNIFNGTLIRLGQCGLYEDQPDGSTIKLDF